MASTYSYTDALAIVGQNFKGRISDNLAVHAVNMALNYLWNSHDWRPTLAVLPPFWLTPNLQDFGKPFTTIPTDFLGLREVYLVSLQSYNNWRRTLTVQTNLEVTHIQDYPKLISFHPEINGFRIWPRVPYAMTAPNWLIDGTYKKKPTKLTTDTMNAAILPWDDLYFHVFIAVLQWAFLFVLNDPKAGVIQRLPDGSYQKTGQIAVADSLIYQMACDEGLNLGDPAIAPSSPLVNPSMLY